MKDDRQKTKDGSTYYNDIKKQRDKEIKGLIPFDGKPATPAQEQTMPGALISLTGGSVQPAQKLFKDIVIGLFLTYFQNPDSKYKNVVNARFNLENGTSESFLAFMTKRWADFQRNVDDGIKDWMNVIRKDIEDQYRIKPYMGKFVLKSKQDKHAALEPDTAVALWFDKNKSIWRAVIKFKSFEIQMELQSEQLTKKQVANNVRATGLYRKETTKRGPTWAEQNPGYK